jgi:hypothetical protein
LIPFSNINSANLTFNGSGTLGGTRLGDDVGSLRVWEGNNSGGLSRCIDNCTAPGASWTSSRGAWTSYTQSFILSINMFHGGIPGGDDCQPPGLTSGCGHLIAASTRVWETISGAAATVPQAAWYITNNPTTQNMTKQTLGNRSQRVHSSIAISSREHTLLVCVFRRLAEKLFEESQQKSPCHTLACSRQPADDYLESIQGLCSPKSAALRRFGELCIRDSGKLARMILLLIEFSRPFAGL